MAKASKSTTSKAAAARGALSPAAPSSKLRVKKTAGLETLPAPKGPRTISHGRIKAAVEKVFRERQTANGD